MSFIITEAERLKASDLHITSQEEAFWRIGGKLVPTAQELVAHWKKEKSMLHAYAEKGSIRLSSFFDIHGENISIRFFTKDIPGFFELGLPAVATELLKVREGLVLISGPTGSGKTTTALSLLEFMLEQEALHAITIEDPIEGSINKGQGVLQRISVGRHIENMEEVVYNSLRYDADILLIGEIRRAETLRAALLAAETGHLVIATTHANRLGDILPSFIGRLGETNQEIIRESLIQQMSGLVCQRLVPRKDGGRILLAEVLPVTEAVRAHLRKNPYGLHTYLEGIHHSQGMSLEKHAAFSIQQGHIEKDIHIPGVETKGIGRYLTYEKF